MATTQATKRLTKHQLKQDAFSNAIFGAREWIEQNLRVTLMVVGGIIVIGALIWGIDYYRTSQTAQAEALFGQAGVDLRGGNLSAGIVNLRKLLDDHSGAKIAGMASVQLADAYFQQRDFEDAKTYYQKYLDSYNNDPMMTAGAWSGLAAIDEQNGKNAEGAQNYLKAAQINPKTFQASEYLRGALRCALGASDSTLALQVYQTMLKDFGPNDQSVKMALQMLAEHRISIPETN